MSYAWDTSHSGALKLMLLAIADRCNDEGECFPGVTRLAEKCGIKKRSAQKILKRLEGLGELVANVQGGTKTKSGNTNTYYMKNYRTSQGIETPDLGTRLEQCITSSLSEEVSNTPPPEKEGVSNKTPDGVSKSTPNTTTDSSVIEKDSAPVPDAVVPDTIPEVSISADEPKEPEPIASVEEKEPSQYLRLFNGVAWGSFEITTSDMTEEQREKLNKDAPRMGLIASWLDKKKATPEQLFKFYIWYKQENDNNNAPRDKAKFVEHWTQFVQEQTNPSEPTLLAPYHKQHVAEDIEISEEEQLAASNFMEENNPFKAKKASGQ